MPSRLPSPEPAATASPSLARRPAAAPHPVLLAAVLLLAAVNLRAAIAGVPPLLPRIERDLHLSAAGAGVLTTLPLVCMGVFAPISQRLAKRVGREATIGWALATLAAGTLIRLGGGSLGLLFGGTFLAGVGIAIGQTVLPAVVKEHFASRGGVVTGLYTTSMAVGATAAAAAAVPLQDATGSWQRSITVWAGPALLGLAVWWPATRPLARAYAIDRRAADPPAGPGLPWRSATAWLISVYLGVQSAMFYSQLSWLAPLYQDHGWAASRAGFALSLFNLLGIGGSLALPWIAGRLHDRRPMFYLAVGASTAGLLGVALVPTTLAWLWVTVLGIGQGGAFSLGLLLLVDHAHDPASSSRLSAMAFLVAYLLAAAGPVALGALRDATGDFRASFLVLVALGVLNLGIAASLSPARRARGVAGAPESSA